MYHIYYKKHDIPYISNSIVLRRSADTNTFYQFYDIEYFKGIYYKMDNNSRYFHEIIYDREQRFHMDIDGKDEYAKHNKRYILNNILGIVKEVYKEKNLDYKFVVYTTFRDNMSFHIVDTKYYLTNSNACMNLYNIILQKLDTKMHKYIDDNMYKGDHSLRIPLSCKYEDNLPKLQIIPRYYVELNYSLVSYVSTAIHTDVFDSNIPKPICLQSTYPYDIKQIDENFKIREQNGNLIILDRIKPSYCNICNRVHDNDNAYLLYKNGKYNFYCYRHKSDERYFATKYL